MKRTHNAKTVPKSPTNGALAPMEAKREIPPQAEAFPGDKLL